MYVINLGLLVGYAMMLHAGEVPMKLPWSHKQSSLTPTGPFAVKYAW
jgi:hypothetical protein